MEYFFPLPFFPPPLPLSLISLAHRVASRRATRIIIAIFSRPLGKFCRAHCEQTIRPYSLPRSPRFFKLTRFLFHHLTNSLPPLIYFRQVRAFFTARRFFLDAITNPEIFSPGWVYVFHTVPLLLSKPVRIHGQRDTTTTTTTTTRFLERSANFPCFRWFIKHRDRVRRRRPRKNFVIRRAPSLLPPIHRSDFVLLKWLLSPVRQTLIRKRNKSQRDALRAQHRKRNPNFPTSVELLSILVGSKETFRALDPFTGWAISLA